MAPPDGPLLGTPRVRKADQGRLRGCVCRTEPGRSNLFLFWDAGGVRAQPSDDVGFVAKLLDDLATVVNVDPNRVYATGMSNGAMMCYRLASELSDRIAAIAPVAGTMATETCHPLRPVPVMRLPRDSRPARPLRRPRPTHAQRSVLQVGRCLGPGLVSCANGCTTTPLIAKLPDQVDDGTTVSMTTYGPGKEGAEVILYVIEGVGTPGRDARPPCTCPASVRAPRTSPLPT